MKLAFVFPGQGSQSVGMLASVAGLPVVADALARAGAALGEDLAGLIARGPAEDLGLTINTQPAMLVAGYALFAAWREAGGPEPQIMAGHSLGEYTALTAAGTFGLEEAVQLVRFRAAAMQQAVPVGAGAMAAILGLADADVAAACAESRVGEEIVEPVNFNAPSKVVIAGHRAAVERACEAARRLGVAEVITGPLCDARERKRVVHTYADMALARMLMISAGYEDCDDIDALRADPALKLACGRCPESGADLMSQSC